MSTTSAPAADMGRRALLSAVPALLAWPAVAASEAADALERARAPDPILAAIETHRAEQEALSMALAACGQAQGSLVSPARAAEVLAEADAAWTREAEAYAALVLLRPRTVEGLHALIRHHASNAAHLEPEGCGALALRDLAAALPPVPAAPARRRFGLPRLATILGETLCVVLVLGGGAALTGFLRLF
ncbi:hypothetical protein LRS73_35590 (plasmid) [Methylobacterium currus]|uniref:hypothetical protein n=1 Tax=Methylobacterium currus TaxID=2051553 RepID=UPI001E611A03|nr:hypothetical protein [Methylobacterium currus]UHC20457.1 hypothetical protein LRS73_35590 [Methylobacterium currus]